MHVDKNILGHEVAWEEDSSVGRYAKSFYPYFYISFKRPTLGSSLQKSKCDISGCFIS